MFFQILDFLNQDIFQAFLLVLHLYLMDAALFNFGCQILWMFILFVPIKMECYATPWSQGGKIYFLLHIVAPNMKFFACKPKATDRGITIREKKLQGGCYSMQQTSIF